MHAFACLGENVGSSTVEIYQFYDKDEDRYYSLAT